MTKSNYTYNPWLLHIIFFSLSLTSCHQTRNINGVEQSDCYLEYRFSEEDCVRRLVCPDGETEWEECPTKKK